MSAEDPWKGFCFPLYFSLFIFKISFSNISFLSNLYTQSVGLECTTRDQELHASLPPEPARCPCFPFSYLKHGCDIWSHSSYLMTMKKQAAGKAKRITEILAGPDITGPLTKPQHPTTSKLLIIREIKPYLFKPWKPGFLFPAAEYTWYRQVSILGLFLIQQTLIRHSRGSMYSLYVQTPRFRPKPYFSLELCSCVSTSPQACVTDHVWHFHYQHLCCKHFCCIANWLQSNFAIKNKNHKK